MAKAPWALAVWRWAFLTVILLVAWLLELDTFATLLPKLSSCPWALIVTFRAGMVSECWTLRSDFRLIVETPLSVSAFCSASLLVTVTVRPFGRGLASATFMFCDPRWVIVWDSDPWSPLTEPTTAEVACKLTFSAFAKLVGVSVSPAKVPPKAAVIAATSLV